MRPSILSSTLVLWLACVAGVQPAFASLKPTGPTSIVTEVYRNPLAEPVLGTRAYLPAAWLAATGKQVANPRGIAPGRASAGSDRFDVATEVNPGGFRLSGGSVAPGEFDAFRMQTRGYFLVDYAELTFDTASGRVRLDDNDPNVLSHILTQSFKPGLPRRRQPAVYTLQPFVPYEGGRYEFEIEDLAVYFGLPLARFTLDTFLDDLPAPDFAQALLTLPPDEYDGVEVVRSARYSNSSYALATIGKVRARDLATGELIDYGSVAFAQTPRGIDEPGTLALFGAAAAALALRRQRTKCRG